MGSVCCSTENRQQPLPACKRNQSCATLTVPHLGISRRWGRMPLSYWAAAMLHSWSHHRELCEQQQLAKTRLLSSPLFRFHVTDIQVCVPIINISVVCFQRTRRCLVMLFTLTLASGTVTV